MSGHKATRTKIYGERNSGTNYLQTLIEQNLDTELVPGTVCLSAVNRPNDQRWRRALGESRWTALYQRRIDRYFEIHFDATLGWKHGCPRPERLKKVSPNTRFVSITKNPYSWVLSFHRRPYNPIAQLPTDIEDFLVTPCPLLGRDGLDVAAASPVELWNIKNRAYLELADHARSVNVTYERLLANPRSAIHRISQALGLTQGGREFTNVEYSPKQDSDATYQGYRDYYLNERWRESLTQTQIKLINRQLDADLCSRLGYQLLEGR